MPAAPSAVARPGALRSRTRGWLRLYSPPSDFFSRRCGLPPPHPRFPLRSACLADGSLIREHRSARQVGAAAPTPSLSAELGLSFIRLASAVNKALGRWGQPPPHLRFPLRSACLAGGSLPRATKRLAAQQVGAAAPIPPLSAALGLSYRRLAPADNERGHGGRVIFFASVHE